MQDPTFWILVVLLEGEAHGYSITQRALELSDGEVKLGAGTLYTALDRLNDSALIMLSKQEIENGRARHYYRLTKDGQQAIAAEIDRREGVMKIAKARLKLASKGGAA